MGNSVSNYFIKVKSVDAIVKEDDYKPLWRHYARGKTMELSDLELIFAHTIKFTERELQKWQAETKHDSELKCQALRTMIDYEMRHVADSMKSVVSECDLSKRIDFRHFMRAIVLIVGKYQFMYERMKKQISTVIDKPSLYSIIDYNDS